MCNNNNNNNNSNSNSMYLEIYIEHVVKRNKIKCKVIIIA